MSLLDGLRTALEALAHNKLRSLLTTLGVIIGVASVIVMVALGTGAREAVKEQFRGLGSNEIQIFGGFRMGKGGEELASKPLTYEEAKGIPEAVPLIEKVKVTLPGMTTVTRGRAELESSTIGTAADYVEDEDENFIAQGEFFSEDDLTYESRVCVIGQTVAKELLPGEDPVGQEIRINRLRFLVIGVIKELPQPDPRSDPNQVIYLPITTAAADLYGRDVSVVAKATVASEEKMDEAMEKIKQYLREKHEIEPGEEDDFTVFSAEAITGAQRESARSFALLLMGTAIVSLIVGGIGIMNVMLVSVTERTREIGIRKAVGARRRDIVQQFLIEAVALSLMGGVLGIAAGVLTIPVAARYNQGIAVLSWQSIPQAFTFSILVGIFFGLYPAVRASRLDPIEALRHE